MAGLGEYSLPIDQLIQSDVYFTHLFSKMSEDWEQAQQLAEKTNNEFKDKARLGMNLLVEGAKKK